MQPIYIEQVLNNILVNNLENHKKEYNKLFRIGKIELEKMLEHHKTIIIEKIVEMMLGRKMYDTWNERIKNINIPFSEKENYKKGYNEAVKEINGKIENLADMLETSLKENLKNI